MTSQTLILYYVTRAVDSFAFAFCPSMFSSYRKTCGLVAGDLIDTPVLSLELQRENISLTFKSIILTAGLFLECFLKEGRMVFALFCSSGGYQCWHLSNFWLFIRIF